MVRALEHDAVMPGDLAETGFPLLVRQSPKKLLENNGAG